MTGAMHACSKEPAWFFLAQTQLDGVLVVLVSFLLYMIYVAFFNNVACDTLAWPNLEALLEAFSRRHGGDKYQELCGYLAECGSQISGLFVLSCVGKWAGERWQLLARPLAVS